MPAPSLLLKAVFTATLAAITFTSCKTSKQTHAKHLPGAWQAKPITVDGYNNDWPSPYPEYDEKAMLGYAVSNDKENLYITIETGDPATQLKILHTGITLWIDKTGGREATTAINFPLPDAYKSQKNGDGSKTQLEEWEEAQRNRPEHKRFELEDRVRKALPSANEFSLQGFKGCNHQFSLLETDTCGIITRLALDSTKELVLEAVIPLRSFYYKPILTRADRGKPLTICIETEAMKRPAGKASSGRVRTSGGIRPSIGVSGLRMGGMGMGMGNGGGTARNTAQEAAITMEEPLYRSTKTIKRFGLAWQD